MLPLPLSLRIHISHFVVGHLWLYHVKYDNSILSGANVNDSKVLCGAELLELKLNQKVKCENKLFGQPNQFIKTKNKKHAQRHIAPHDGC